MERPIFEHSRNYERDMEKVYLQKFFDNELKSRCHTKVMDLSVTYAASDEPVPFSKIHTLPFIPLQVGDVWATKNFACAWFHLTGTLSENCDRETLYLDFGDDGEGLLVDHTGHALKGFTSGSLVFGIKDNASEKRYYPLAGLIDDAGNIDLYIDGASNNIVGEFFGEARLTSSAVVRRDERMFSLYQDFDILYDYLKTLPYEDDKKKIIREGLRKIMNIIIYNVPDALNKANAIVADLYSLQSPGDKTKVTAVGHAHLDLAWLWPMRESKRKALRTFANAVRLAERYPSFRFIISQPQQLVWVKELDSKLYEEVCTEIRSGVFEIAGGWVETDTNLPCGESLVRQQLYGQKFWKENFGRYVDVCWLPDTFGYSGALPQILAQSRQKYFMTIKLSWSHATRFPYHSFYWQGIDGSKVLVHMPPEGNYNSVAAPSSLVTAKGNMMKSDPKDHFMLVYGVGDGGGGPSEVTVERCLRMANVNYLPKVQTGTAQSYFNTLEKEKLPVYNGEMYLERHRATYTSQSDNKFFNREIESRLIAIEMLLASRGEQGDKQRLDKIWKEVLLYQFHDILPGSCIDRVYKETAKRYEDMLSVLETEVNGMGATFIPGKNKLLINFIGKTVARLVGVGNAYYWYKGSDALVAPVIYDVGKTAVVSKFESESYAIEFAENGAISKILLKKSGRCLAAPANRLQVYIDVGDAWDFEYDYRDQPRQYMELTSVAARDFGDLVEVRQQYSYKNSHLTQTILLHRHDPLIRIMHDVDWKDTGYMLRAEFEAVPDAEIARSDIQFGYLPRPVIDKTEHDAAQFETCCQKWFDVSEENCGISVLNNVKCGFMAKGRVISLNLLRSTDYPSRASDQHPLHYEYAVYPHEGGFDPVVIDELAEEFNERSLYGDKAAEVPAFDDPRICVSAFKPAYDGNGFILRAFERSGGTVTARLKLPEGFDLTCETDLIEEKIGPAPAAGEKVTFSAFRIRSFRLNKKQ